MTDASVLGKACAPASWRAPQEHLEAVLSSPWFGAVAELTGIFHHATVDFWRDRGVLAAYLPMTTGSVSSPMGLGSDSSPVQVEMFGVPTYLADSMQFPLELACRLTPAGSYYVMPSFRGEQADRTHLCQFYHSEAEIPGDLGDVMAVVEQYIRHLGAAMLEHGRGAVTRIAGDDSHLRALADLPAFASMEFDEAATELGHDPEFVTEVAPGARTLTRAGELEVMRRRGDFTWVTHNDHLSVPFYQAFSDSSRARANNGDLLFGIGETVGAGERHATAEQVRSALELHCVDEACYAWYLRMRELAPMQTSGFGLGVERFLLWVLQHDDIRDIPMLLRFNGQRIDP